MVSVVAYREEEAEHVVIVKAISGAIQISSVSVSIKLKGASEELSISIVQNSCHVQLKCFVVNLLCCIVCNKTRFLFPCCERLAFVLIVRCFLFQLVNVIQPDRPPYIVNVTLGNVNAYQESVATNVTAVQEEQRDKYLIVNRVASALIIGIVSLRNSKVS